MDLATLRQQPHLSASSIGDYIECSLLFKFGRIDRLPMEFKSDALEFGTTIHLVLAAFYQEKMSGHRMPLKDLHRLFEMQWREIAEDNADIRYAQGRDFQSYLHQGIDMLTVWYNKAADDDSFRVLSVEEPFQFTLPDLPVRIIGAMDLVEEDDSGAVIITDWKTAGRAYGYDEVNRNPQVTLYQLAAKSNGFADREILLRFDCLLKTQKPRFEQYYTIRTDIEERRLIRKIRAVWEGISSGIFIPNDTSWRCPNCHYRQACDQWFLEGGD